MSTTPTLHLFLVSGYSTDGASPGDALHPEYYINIRTGKHYFPSPAPTPTSPHPHPRACITTSFLSTEPRIPPLTTFPSWLAEPTPLPDTRLTPTAPQQCVLFKSPKKSPPKSPLSSLKSFLKSPKQDKVKPKSDFKTPAFENKKSPSKSRKWYKQPFKFSHKSSESEVKTDERKEGAEIHAEHSSPPEVIAQDKAQVSFPGEAAASPRQRNRIRTNPWIPTEPLSSNNFHQLQLNFPPNFLRNRSCTNTPLQQRKTPDEPPLHDCLQEMTVQYQCSRDYLATLEKVVGQHIGQKMLLDMSDHSEEDLTLNEMMGTFNESYVYEKETDILSDSDPTDCEDYVSDSEANHGGDEDSHDDELDFIDTGSLVDDSDIHLNTGKCSYHDVSSSKNSFLYRNRPQNSLDAENRRNSRKEKEAKKRRREEKKRRSLRKVEKEEEGSKVERTCGGTVSLRKVLLQRMLDKNCSKSAESSPVGLRRKQLAADLRETHIGSPKMQNKYDLSALADAEADKKYNELIQEAEIMLESLKNTPVPQKRFQNPADVEETWSPRPQTRSPLKSSPRFDNRRDTPRRSPKNLGLKLSVGGAGRRPDEDKKSSFRAKSSAHSPLDPLGPTFRNFSVFKASSPAKKISSSSSEDSDTVLPRAPPVPSLPFGFQFVDLGRPMTSHCPQSEPVKRKMYTCSKTFDRLVRTFDAPPSPRPRKVQPPAFYNPMYSPVPALPASHLGRRLSDGLELFS